MSSSGAGQSSVGSRAIYEAGDQRNVPQSEINEQNRYAEGQKNSHKNLDSSMPPSSLLPSNHSGDIVLTNTKTEDQRSIGNKLASQERKPESDHHHNFDQNPEAELSKQDPTKPVCPISYLYLPWLNRVGSMTDCLCRPRCMVTSPPRVLRSMPNCRLRMSSACVRRALRNK